MTVDGDASDRLYAALEGAGLTAHQAEVAVWALSDLCAELRDEMAQAVEQSARGYRHHLYLVEPHEAVSAVLRTLGVCE